MPSSWGIFDRLKVFSKLYNVFYCPKRPQHCPPPDPPDEGIRMKSEWLESVKNNSIQRVKELVKRGVDVNISDEHGWSALHIVSWNGYTEICQDVLTNPSLDLNKAGPCGSTPIALASQRGHADVVRLLIDAKCDIQKAAQLGDSHDVTPLHVAAQNGHTEIVKMLVTGGAIVNATMSVREIQGVTPLHLAVEADHLDVMDVLIEAGCDINSSTQSTTEADC